MTIGTHENIINAFFRLAAKKDARTITMSEIANESHVSRQAIYQKHFKSIDEIIDEIHSIIYQDVYSLLRKFDPSKMSLNRYIATYLLPGLYEHRDWIRILHTSNIDFSWQGFISQQYSPLLDHTLEQASEKLNLSKEFLKIFIIRYYSSIISAWLIQEMPMPPDLFSKYFLKLTSISIEDYFDN